MTHIINTIAAASRLVVRVDATILIVVIWVCFAKAVIVVVAVLYDLNILVIPVVVDPFFLPKQFPMLICNLMLVSKLLVLTWFLLSKQRRSAWRVQRQPHACSACTYSFYICPSAAEQTSQFAASAVIARFLPHNQCTYTLGL